MGSRPTREGETGPLRHPDGGQRGVDAPVRLARDQRRLGRCVADVVAPGSAGPWADQAPCDLFGQRSEELGPSDAVLEANGRVRGLVGVGDSLSTTVVTNSEARHLASCNGSVARTPDGPAATPTNPAPHRAPA